MTKATKATSPNHSDHLIHQLSVRPAFTGAVVAKLCNVSEQRLQQWIKRKVIKLGENSMESGRRLFTLREVLQIALTARVIDSHDIAVSTAALIGRLGSYDIIREWMQAASWRDTEATRKFTHDELVAGYFLKPDPFGALDDAEERMASSNIHAFPAGGRGDDTENVNIFAHSSTVGEVMATAGSPVLLVDLAPICRGILKPACEILRRNVVITLPGVPDEVWEKWKREGGIPAELKKP